MDPSQSAKSHKLSLILDASGCVDRSKLFEYEHGRPSKHLCLFCPVHETDTFEEIIQHILDAHGPLVERCSDLKMCCLYAVLGFPCREGFTAIFGNRFASLLGTRAQHMLFGNVLMCHYSLPFPSTQHLGVHHLECAIDPTTTDGSSYAAWYLHGFRQATIASRVLPLLLEKEVTFWVLVEKTQTSTTPAKKFDIKSKSSDRVLCARGVHVPTIFMFRRSQFNLSFLDWSDSYKSNAGFLMDEHRKVFDTKGEQVLLPIGVSSRVFLLVPSSPVRKYLETEMAVPEDISPEYPGFHAIEASAILASTLSRFSEKWPDVWPVLAFSSDRFSCAMINMAMFNYSAITFHLHYKLNMEEFIYALMIVDDKVDSVTSVALRLSNDARMASYRG